MEVTSLCLIISATLSIDPNKSQFFRYDHISLSCEAPVNSSGWTLRKKASSEMPQPCDGGCILEDVYPEDSGVYWCVSEKDECSNAVNITVAAGVVILESPALPVTEGDTVMLHCSYKERLAKNPTSDFNATFYKDGEFIGTKPAGKLILSSVSTDQEGFYKCEHPEKGQSEQSWLSVTGQPSNVSPTPPPPVMSLHKLVCTILLFILYTAILILAIYTYRRWARARAHAKKRVSDHLVLD